MIVDIGGQTPLAVLKTRAAIREMEMLANKGVFLKLEHKYSQVLLEVDGPNQKCGPKMWAKVRNGASRNNYRRKLTLWTC